MSNKIRDDEIRERFISMISEKNYSKQSDFLKDYIEKFPDHEIKTQAQISKFFAKFSIEKNENTHYYEHARYYTEEESEIVWFLEKSGIKTSNIYSEPFFCTITVETGTEQYLCKLLSQNYGNRITALLIGYSSVTVICQKESNIKEIRKFVNKITRRNQNQQSENK